MGHKRGRIVCAITVLTLFSLGTSQALAEWWWPPLMTVTPAKPTSACKADIKLKGEWPNSCIPTGSEISVTGNEIHFKVLLPYPLGTFCLQVITPWSQTQSVGPLDPGKYSVYASAWNTYTGQVHPPTFVGEFTVFKTGDLNCDGRVDFDDIDPFVLALTGRAAYEAKYPNCNWLSADCNCDGTVDFNDIDPFVALLTG